MSKRKLNQAKWYSLIEQYQSRGLSIREFCQTESINKHSFSYWLGKYRNQNRDETGGEEKFISIQPLNNSGQIYIRYPGGVELELPYGYPVDEITKLIRLSIC